MYSFNIVYSFLSFIYDFLFAIYRDIMGTRMLIKTTKRLAKFEKENSTVFEEFQKNVKKSPNKACILFDDQVWTFKDVC